MANHQGRSTANMAYRWTAESLQALSLAPEELLKLPYAPVDLEYYALRDIAADEELTIDYGEDWVNAWASYTSSLLSTTMHELAYQRHGIKFRHPMVLKQGLLPSEWNASACLGDKCGSVDVARTTVNISHTEL